MIVKIPDQQEAGNPSEALVEFVDLLPTISELANLPAPTPASGKSFASVVNNSSLSHKEYAFSQYPRTRNGISAMGYSVRSRDWRYTQWRNRDSGEVLTEELYDLNESAYEQVNLAKREEHSAKLVKLRNIISINQKEATF